MGWNTFLIDLSFVGEAERNVPFHRTQGLLFLDVVYEGLVQKYCTALVRLVRASARASPY